MLKSVHIKNFEAHADTFLELSSGINVISGASDNGKSSIVKALNWCLFNQPQGFSFKKHNCRGATVVKVEFDDGTYIERRRDAKLNQYDCNGEILTALGSGVPDAVKEITNIKEINIQKQFDQFYLLQDSSGEVARTLNGIVGLDCIDSALSAAGSFVKQYKNKLEEKESQIKEISAAVDVLGWTLKATDMVIEMEGDIEKDKQLSELSGYLESLNNSLQTLEDRLSNIPLIDISLINKISEFLNSNVEWENKIAVLEELSVKFFELRKKLKDIFIADVADRMNTLTNKIKEYNNLMDNEINLNRILEEHERANSAYNDTEAYLSCKGLYSKLSSDVVDLNVKNNDLKWLEQQLDAEREINEGVAKILAVNEKYKKRQEEIKLEAKICPVCKKPFDGECC